MATKTKAWSSGTGSTTIEYGGQGDGQIIITSDANNLYETRSMQITIGTTDGSNIQKAVTINQAAKQRINISSAVVTASNQTYNGSAKTPTPTVKLNGVTIPSSGYDVAYSNNTNAGTATITVTGKGEYTGTATGTFTIAKASRTLSFADSYAVVAPSSTVTKKATPSAGSDDGGISYSSSNTSRATVNSSSGKVTAKTSEGSCTITATIAEGTNYLSASASYTLYVFATTHNYDYTGSAKSVTLPPGTYQLQCWGAQGGSNAAVSAYGITAQAGGKGGYSVGQLTTAEALAIQVLVGGQGTSSTGGYNGGGSSTGSSTLDESDEQGVSRMGGGGGATDIRLSSGTLLSRMIVAGGGSGGAMVYQKTVSSSTETETESVDLSNVDIQHINIYSNSSAVSISSQPNFDVAVIDVSDYVGWTFKIKTGGICNSRFLSVYPNVGYYTASVARGNLYKSSGGTYTMTVPQGAEYVCIYMKTGTDDNDVQSVEFSHEVVVPIVVENRESQQGFVGGGTNGGGDYYGFYGTQSSAGANGSFGSGGGHSRSNMRYASGAGGGGWYGGGCAIRNSGTYTVKQSGGGSGWVNIAANAGNRPSGYTGLELDSGTTYAGNTSFPAPGGGTEYGHSGNGYVRITRIS